MHATLLNIILIIALIYGGICVIYFFIQEKFIFVPTFNLNPFQNKISTLAVEHSIETPNNGRIHALLLRHATPTGLVFYLHGNTGNLKRWQFMAEEICQYGFDVFAPDYRGYGESSGKRSESYMHRDIEACYDHMVKLYPNLPVILYGRSLGTGFATRLASRKPCSKLVLETPFYNFIEVAKHYLPFLPIRALLRYKFRSDIYITHIHCPIIILHGTKDIIVPHSHALKLFRQAKAHQRDVKMATIVGGKHGNLNAYPLFREKLREFLCA